MPRGDWGDQRGPRGPGPADRPDFGQVDYSTDYAYDPRRRVGYRVQPDARRPQDEYDPPPRSWEDHPRGFGGPITGPDHPASRRRGPSDRVLWAVIVERLEDERLDLRDVDVIVEDAEVTLNGSVRRKADKRRIEDVADIDGIRHVQNNLRVRDHHWTFL